MSLSSFDHHIYIYIDEVLRNARVDISLQFPQGLGFFLLVWDYDSLSFKAFMMVSNPSSIESDDKVSEEKEDVFGSSLSVLRAVER